MDFYLLDLRRSTKDSLIGDNTIKANIFAVKFFFKTGAANLNNMAIEVCKTCIKFIEYKSD